MRYRVSFAMVAGMLVLASCGQSPPTTAVDDQRIDQAMAKVKIEQDRTDKAEAQKQRTELELLNRRSSNTAPVLEAPIRQIAPVVPQPYTTRGSWPPRNP